MAAIACISCWQPYRQSLSRTPFLTEHIYKRLTFSVFIIQSKEKQSNSRGFWPILRLFLRFETHMKLSIHSCILLLKQQTWKSKRKSCTSSEIRLLSIFEILGQKLEVLWSIFCGTKINLEWITRLPVPSHF